MSSLEHFDLDQLLLNIHGELSQLMTEARSDNGKGLKIEQLNFRMGQRLKPGQENALESERYPSNEDWQVDLHYRPGMASAQLNQPPALLRSEELMERIGMAPITVVKGVDTFWAKRWKDLGVSSLADLFYFEARRFWQSGANPASKMIGHYSQIRLLAQNYLPLLERSLYHQKLALFWKASPAALKSAFYPLSDQQIFSYQQQAWGLAAVLDLNFVQSLSLSIWAAAKSA